MNIQGLAYSSEGNNHYLQLTSKGDSNAIAMESKFIRPVTVVASNVVSSVAGRKVTVEYTLSSSDRVINNVAIWHESSIGDISAEGGTSFDSPVTHIRIFIKIPDTADGSDSTPERDKELKEKVSWTLEVLT